MPEVTRFPGHSAAHATTIWVSIGALVGQTQSSEVLFASDTLQVVTRGPRRVRDLCACSALFPWLLPGCRVDGACLSPLSALEHFEGRDQSCLPLSLLHAAPWPGRVGKVLERELQVGTCWTLTWLSESRPSGDGMPLGRFAAAFPEMQTWCMPEWQGAAGSVAQTLPPLCSSPPSNHLNNESAQWGGRGKRRCGEPLEGRILGACIYRRPLPPREPRGHLGLKRAQAQCLY